MYRRDDLLVADRRPTTAMRGGLLFLLAAVVMDTHVAADTPAGTSRVRRVDRDADADQPAARESTKRRAAQRW